MLALAGVVVIVSVVVHGISAAPAADRYARAVARKTLAEEREATTAGLFQHEAMDVPRITPAQLVDRLKGPEPPVVLDVRTRSSFEADKAEIPGSVRVLPDHVAEWAAGQPHGRAIVAYCT